MTPSEIKSREGLSRYSYRFVVNRLIKAELIEDRGDSLLLLKKGLNVPSFDRGKDRKEVKIVVQIAAK